MIRYDVRSPRADDFINHQEILDTLAYAAMHRHDAALARDAKLRGKVAVDAGDGFHVPASSAVWHSLLRQLSLRVTVYSRNSKGH